MLGQTTGAGGPRMVKIPSAGVLYHESEFVCPQAGPLRCGRSHLRGALHGIAAVLLRRSAGARGRGALPAARVRPGVHRRCRAGLLPGQPAGFHHRGRHLRHTGHPAGLPCDLQAADLRFKGLALAASLPPVLFNAVIIGIEIAVLFPDPSSSAPLWLACITNGISVGIGELISCTVLGVLLVKIIETNAALRKVFVSE